MRALVLSIILIHFYSNSFSQQILYEDLDSVLVDESIPLSKRGLWIQYYVTGVHGHPEEKLKRLIKVWPKVKKHNQAEFFWNWHIGYDFYLRESGQLNKCMTHSYMMLSIANDAGNPAWISEARMRMYGIYSGFKMENEAIRELELAHPFSLKSGDARLITNNSYLLGYSYYNLGKNKKAINMLETSVEYNGKMALDEYTSEYEYLLARVYIRDVQYQKAIDLLRLIQKKSKQVFHEYYTPYYIAGADLYISQTYALMGQVDSSNVSFQRALDLYKQFDENLYRWAYYYSARTYLNVSRYEEAQRLINYLIDSTDFEIDYAVAAEIEMGLMNERTALDYYGRAIQKRDSSHREEMQAISALLNQSSKAELEIQKQIDEEKRATAQARADSQEFQKLFILTAVGVGIFALVIFGRILFKRYKIIKAQKQEIQLQKMQVEEKNQEILDSITYAKRIQEAILPTQELLHQALPDSFVYYKPKDLVAGDFYWLTEVGDLVLFAAADCTGHGVPGAMVSVVCHNALNRAVLEHKLLEPARILDKTRELVIETFETTQGDVKDGMDISLCALNKTTNELHYSGANNSLYICRGEEIIETKADKQPIGKFAEEFPFTNHKIDIQSGDTIYLFTDGYADQFGGDKGKKFKYKSLRTLFAKISKNAMSDQLSELDRTLENWKGDLDQVDDVCVIGVRV